jgi:predicted  nucleic acid-binding Zn-ribbon protein
LLKAQIDDLAVENSALKAKADGLSDEVAQLKNDSTKAQELANQRRMEAKSKEKDLQQRLQSALDSLHGKPDSLFSMRFMRVSSIF